MADFDTIKSLAGQVGVTRQWCSHLLNLGMPRQPEAAKKWLDDRRSKSDERAARYTFDGTGGAVLTSLDRTLLASMAGGEKERKALDFASSLIRTDGYSEAESLAISNYTYGTQFPTAGLKLVEPDEARARAVVARLKDSGTQVVDAMQPGSAPRSAWDTLTINRSDSRESLWYRLASERRGEFASKLADKLASVSRRKGASWQDDYAEQLAAFDAKLVAELDDLRAKAK